MKKESPQLLRDVTVVAELTFVPQLGFVDSQFPVPQIGFVDSQFPVSQLGFVDSQFPVSQLGFVDSQFPEALVSLGTFCGDNAPPGAYLTTCKTWGCSNQLAIHRLASKKFSFGL